MQALSVVEDDARRCGGPREVATWLMTPSAVSNRVPFDLLKEHQYDLCQSLLTRTSRRRLPERRRRQLGPNELRQEVDRITARAATEDYEDTDD